MLMIVVSTTSVGTVIGENKTISYSNDNQCFLLDKQLLRIFIFVGGFLSSDTIQVDAITIEGNGHIYDKDDCHWASGEYRIYLDSGDYTVKVTLGLRSKTGTITLTPDYPDRIDFRFWLKDASVSVTDSTSSLSKEIEEKNIVLKQKNKTEPMASITIIELYANFIGFVNNRTETVNSVIFHASFLLCTGDIGFHIFTSNEYFEVKNDYTGYIGQKFIITHCEILHSHP